MNKYKQTSVSLPQEVKYIQRVGENELHTEQF